ESEVDAGREEVAHDPHAAELGSEPRLLLAGALEARERDRKGLVGRQTARRLVLDVLPDLLERSGPGPDRADVRGPLVGLRRWNEDVDLHAIPWIHFRPHDTRDRDQECKRQSAGEITSVHRVKPLR